MSKSSPITTHILDTAKGCPAADVEVRVDRMTGPDQWQEIAHKKTNSDGRVSDLLEPGTLKTGTYRIRFAVGAYLGNNGFYPEVPVIFKIKDPGQHYHVPLLISPYGYSTYRGS